MDFGSFSLVNLAVQGPALLICLALIGRLAVRPSLLIVGAVVVLAIEMVVLVVLFPDPLFAFDYKLFWKIGQDVWAGLNPYAAERFGEHPFLNPPWTLPMFASFAALPMRLSCGLWTILSVITVCGLPYLAQRTLLAQERLDAERGGSNRYVLKMPVPILVGLTASLAASTACFTTLCTGQLSIVAAVA